MVRLIRIKRLLLLLGASNRHGLGTDISMYDNGMVITAPFD